MISDGKTANIELHKGGLGVMGGGGGREWVAVFNGLIRLGLDRHEKRLEGGQGISHVRGSILVRGNSQCKDPKLGICLMYWKNGID